LRQRFCYSVVKGLVNLLLGFLGLVHGAIHNCFIHILTRFSVLPIEAPSLINAGENLKALFNGKKQVSMFETTKLVSGHVKK